MISIVGIGNAASAIAEKFSSVPQYNGYKINSNAEKSTDRQYKLNVYETPEEYEANVPNLKKFFTKF